MGGGNVWCTSGSLHKTSCEGSFRDRASSEKYQNSFFLTRKPTGCCEIMRQKPLRRKAMSLPRFSGGSNFTYFQFKLLEKYWVTEGILNFWIISKNGQEWFWPFVFLQFWVKQFYIFSIIRNPEEKNQMDEISQISFEKSAPGIVWAGRNGRLDNCLKMSLATGLKNSIMSSRLGMNVRYFLMAIRDPAASLTACKLSNQTVSYLKMIDEKNNSSLFFSITSNKSN